jgi:hypothetical protein
VRNTIGAVACIHSAEVRLRNNTDRIIATIKIILEDFDGETPSGGYFSDMMMKNVAVYSQYPSSTVLL